MTQYFGQVLCLRNDPVKIATYKEAHQQVWPGVTARLRDVGVHEMRIFLRGLYLFMYLETDDQFDPVRDFPRINDDPTSAEWNRWMAELQERAPEAAPDEWWALMEPVFDLNWPQHQASKGAQA